MLPTEILWRVVALWSFLFLGFILFATLVGYAVLQLCKEIDQYYRLWWRWKK